MQLKERAGEIKPMDNQQIKDDLLKSAAAGKIYAELKKLNDSGKEKQDRYRRRWVWELIQNASDCCKVGETIDIEISFDGHSKLTFSHNGLGFSGLNLWSIVTQVSSKLSDDNTTGQFGTGFISTTLLSPFITIESFLENEKTPFILEMDRSGNSAEEISRAIDVNIKVIEKVIDSDYVFTPYNKETTFSYDLNYAKDKEKAIEAIESGISSLEKHILCLLSFNEKLASISFNGKKYAVESREINGNIFNSEIIKIKEEFTKKEVTLITYNFEGGTLAIPLVIEDEELRFSEIAQDEARLYCNFPLLGTEQFPFPLILNSKDFSVEMDRDGIFEADQTNIKIIRDAIHAYEVFLDSFSSFPQTKLFNLCKFNRISTNDFTKNLIKRLDSIILKKKIVDVNDGTMSAILDSQEEKQIFVPKANKEDGSEQIWNLFSKIPNVKIPAYLHAEGWRDVINNNISIKDINTIHLKGNTLNDFKKWFGYDEVIDWLNNYYQYVDNLEERAFSEVVIPNRMGDFCNLSDLTLIDDVLPELLEIYLQINKPFYNKLVHEKIRVTDKMKSKMSGCTNEYIVTEISDQVLLLLSKENKETRSQETELIFSNLLSMFSQKNTDWEKLFPRIYGERAKLRSLQFSEKLNQLGDLASEKNISIDSISLILSNEEILESVLTSPDNLSEDIKQQLRHISKSSLYSWKKVEKLIQRSIENVYKELSANPKYEISNNLYEWCENRLSTTIFKARKEDEDIFIVVRPSDEDKVIFYDDQEFSVLESDKYELWTDNGEFVRKLTLGDILKTTGITVIPLRNLYEEEIGE